MRFFIDYDDARSIRGWIVPDNPLAISRVVVSVEGRRVAEVAASIVDETFRREGHATGQCVFVLTEAEVPGLPGLPQLELYDANTNVLVYRRVPAQVLVRRRVLLVNTGIEPVNALQMALFPHFQQCYFGLHQMSDEILTSILGSQTMRSAFLSGNLVIPRYENYCLPDLMLTTILVQDPYLELAARMLWLKGRAAEAADANRRWRLGPLGEAVAFTDSCDLTDAKGLKRYFQMLPEPAYRLLYNPLTRQLGTRMPDDRLHPGNSIAAIEILSRIGIAGHKTRFSAFVSTLYDQLGLDAPIPVLPEPPPETRALAERLRAIKAVEDMLVFDVALSDAVLGSVDKVWH